LDRRKCPELPGDLRQWPDAGVALELNAILVKACAGDARQRYASAEALLADLRHLAEGRSVKRRRAWQQTQRHLFRFGVAAVLGVAVWLVFTRFNGSTIQRLNTPAPTSIFVLPFRNDGTNRTEPQLRDRMTDAFINSLKVINGVTIAQRRSALANRPLAEARAEAARLFGVRYVLTGRVKSDVALTLSLDLLETCRELPVWSRTFAGDTNRLIELEEQALFSLATNLQSTIPVETRERIRQVLADNLLGWRLVREGRSNELQGTRASADLALIRYNEALRLDPDYLDALERKAQYFRELSGNQRPRIVWPAISAEAERMIQIDPTYWAGDYFRWMTQLLHDWNWREAERTFQLRRARHADWPVVSAMYLRIAGRMDEARIEQAKVANLDQTNRYVRNHAAAAAFVDRDYARTVAEGESYNALQPGSTLGLEWVFQGQFHLGRYDQSLETIRRLRGLNDAPLLKALEACALVKLDRPEAARELLAELDRDAKHRDVDPYPLAWVHLALGDKAAALRKLREAIEEKSELVVFTDMAGGLRTDPKLDELRGEPEFQDLLKLAGMDVWPK
jgi:TolB-like protein